MTIVSKPHLVK